MRTVATKLGTSARNSGGGCVSSVPMIRRMDSWTAAECIELARAITAAGDTFYMRRVWQRLERGEVTIGQAARLLSRETVVRSFGGRSRLTRNLPGRIIAPPIRV